MKVQPTEQEAQEAEHFLESLIYQFSDEARAPWERGTPNPHPTWVPRLSTLKYNPLRGGGWLWTMDANDSQIVAYYVVPPKGEPFGRVTSHGQARAGFQKQLKEHYCYPTLTPSRERYDFREQHDLDNTMWREREEAYKE